MNIHYLFVCVVLVISSVAGDGVRTNYVKMKSIKEYEGEQIYYLLPHFVSLAAAY